MQTKAASYILHIAPAGPVHAKEHWVDHLYGGFADG